MKNEKMLNILYEIKNDGVNIIKIDEWIESLKKDIALEGCKDNTEKGMVREAIKLLKDHAVLTRPALQKSAIVDIDGIEYQCMTDSYRLVCLKKFIDVPIHDEKTRDKFPDIKRLLPNTDYIEKKEFTYKEINTLFKQTPKIDGYKITKLDFNGDIATCNLSYLVSIFKLLGSNKVEIEFRGGFKPLIIRSLDNDNGFALLTTLRTYD